MHHLLFFVAGLLLCNCIPHLAAGLRGEPFPTPFSKPRGVGLSSPLLNFLWGTSNLAAFGWLIEIPRMIGSTFSAVMMLVGFLVAGLYLARHFGRVRPQQDA
jgi:hypothetical protein